MKFSLNKLWIGALVGILTPVITLLLVYNSKYETLSFMEFIDYIKRIGVYTKLLSICVIPNIFFFFVFIWRKYLAAAKGTLFSTMLYAALVILLMYVF